jgi:hypothetical protein
MNEILIGSIAGGAGYLFIMFILNLLSVIGTYLPNIDEDK